MGAVAVGVIFFAILLAIVAAMVWQEVRNVRWQEQVLLLASETIEFMSGGLPEPTSGWIAADNVRMMPDAPMDHSQVGVARGHSEVCFPGGPGAAAVGLDLEGECLVSIGAVGEIVEEERP